MNLPDNVELGLFGCACVLFLPVPISILVIGCTKSAAMKMLYRLLGYVQSRHRYVNDLRFHMVCLKIQGAVKKNHSVTSTDRSSMCEGVGAWKHGKLPGWKP